MRRARQERRLRRAAATPRVADVYGAIADSTRRQLLDLLGRGEQPVRQLAMRFRITRPAVSQHLGILRRAGLVGVRRAGRHRYYRLRAAPLREVRDWVAHYEKFWRASLAALREYLDRQP